MFGLEKTLRSLTRSPFDSILAAAHRMARPHFEEGGTVPTEGRVVEEPIEQDFVLPPDVDPLTVAFAIDEKLRDGPKVAGLGDDPMRLLERRAGGRIVVAGHHLPRLGDGNFAKGKQFMHSLIARIRHRQ
jgi:hypothetical protein